MIDQSSNERLLRCAKPNYNNERLLRWAKPNYYANSNGILSWGILGILYI